VATILSAFEDWNWLKIIVHEHPANILREPANIPIQLLAKLTSKT
jgi:hypothetical protein